MPRARRTARISAILLTLALSIRPAAAQGPEDEVQALEAPTAEIPDLQPIVKRWSEGHRWVSTDLRAPVRGLVRLQSGTLLTLTEDGLVYVRAEGQPWRRASLPSSTTEAEEGPSEEDLLLEAESAVEDALEDSVDTSQSGESTEPYVQDDGEIEVEAPEAIEIDTSDALESGLGQLTDEDEGASGSSPAGGLWVLAGDPEVVLVSRPGGAWRSTDGGLSWDPVPTLPPTSTVVSVGGAAPYAIAATAEGLRYSGDNGEVWFTIESPIDQGEVRGLATDGLNFWAGTAEGLFRSEDGVRWVALRPAGLPSAELQTLAVDPAWEGGLWLVTSESVLRSDDGGVTVRPVGRNPLKGTHQLLPQAEPGHLFAVGANGVWESLDGGLRWTPIAEGLPSPDQTALVFDRSGPVVGGQDGVFALMALEDSPTVASGIPEEQAPPPVVEVMQAALRRNGATMTPLHIQHALVRSLLSPSLVLFGAYNRRQSFSADIPGLSNAGTTDSDVSAGLSLCFGRCGSTTSSTGDETEVEDIDIDSLTESGDIVVVGDDAYLTEAGDYSALAANVANRISSYRTTVSDQVADLYFARKKLVAERNDFQGLPLREQTRHELEIQLVTARLDALTDGYFSAALSPPAQSGS